MNKSLADEFARIAELDRQARLARDNNVAAMLKAHDMDEHEFIEWIKERL